MLRTPAPLTHAQVCAVLTNWAQTTWLVDADHFAKAQITITDRRQMDAWRIQVIESREERWRWGYGSSKLTAVTEWPTLPATNWAAQTFTFFVEGSIERVECTSCHGRGGRHCAVERVCIACGGRGRRPSNSTDGGMVPCSSCAAGRVLCSDCHGSGWLSCEFCSGAGTRTGYRTLQANRRVTKPNEDVRSEPNSPIPLRRGDWSATQTFTPVEHQEGLTEEEAARVAGLVDQRLSVGNIATAIGLRFAPLTQVSYTSPEGNLADAWLIGESNRVVAAHATRSRTALKKGALVFIGLIALLVAVYLWSLRTR